MDKLGSIFKEQLENHQIAHRAELWDLLNEKLTKRNTSQFIAKSAAAVVLLCLCASVVWHHQVNQQDIFTEKVTITIYSLSSKEIEPKQTDQLALNDIEIPLQKAVEPPPPQDFSSKTDIAHEEIAIVHFAQKSHCLVEKNQMPKIMVVQKVSEEIKYIAIYSAAEKRNEEQTFLDKVFATAIDIKNGESNWNLRDAKNQLVDKIKNLN